MVVNSKQAEILKSYIPNIEEIIASGNVQPVLDAIDDVILNNILGNNDEPDNEGIILQQVYDEIFNQN